MALLKVIESYNEKSDIFFLKRRLYIKIKITVIENRLKKMSSSYFIRLYERQNCPESDLYGSTQVESPICTQYRLGVRFVRACHLALICPSERSVVKRRPLLPKSIPNQIKIKTCNSKQIVLCRKIGNGIQIGVNNDIIYT